MNQHDEASEPKKDEGNGHGHRRYNVHVDEDHFDFDHATVTGRELLALAKKPPCRYALVLVIPKADDQFIDPGETWAVHMLSGHAGFDGRDDGAHLQAGDTALLQARAWTPPTLAGTRLYVRNRQTMAAYELPAEKKRTAP